MPLQYIIDGYNITNHTAFTQIRKKIRDPKTALVEFLRHQRLRKKSRNRIILVFDGYPQGPEQKSDEAGIEVVFSRGESADARIKKMVESAKNPRLVAVVSDDREVQFFIKSAGASAISVEEFISPPKKTQAKNEDPVKAELNYSQISRINQELKELWLKD